LNNKLFTNKSKRKDIKNSVGPCSNWAPRGCWLERREVKWRSKNLFLAYRQKQRDTKKIENRRIAYNSTDKRSTNKGLKSWKPKRVDIQRTDEKTNKQTGPLNCSTRQTTGKGSARDTVDTAAVDQSVWRC